MFFPCSLLVMSSNLGNELWMGKNGASEVDRTAINAILQSHFRPEFLNRIDEIVIFHPLDKEHLKEIVDIQLHRVEALLRDRGYTLEITPEARQYLADAGYDPDFGARPLKRAIQRELQDPLAMEVLSGSFKPGDRILVDAGPDGLEFQPVAQKVLEPTPE